MRLCSITGCERKHEGNGFCRNHNRRYKKYGDPLHPIIIGKHKKIKTPEYRAWARMKERCFNKKCKSYKDYGGKGVTVCPEWVSDFLSFYSYIGERPSPSHSLDRINVYGNYEPGNVRWADRFTQARNKRVGVQNKTGVRGVYLYKPTKRWVANITVNKKRIILGYFKSFSEAVNARKSAEDKYWR